MNRDPELMQRRVWMLEAEFRMSNFSESHVEMGWKRSWIPGMIEG